MRILRLIFSDFRGLIRTCGWIVALRWLLAIAMHLPECKRRGNLAPADRVFGDGPMRIHGNGRELWIGGSCVLTGIREIWVRDSYFKDGVVWVPDNGTVVDLGAGSGNFTLRAVTSAKNVRAVAVEAEAERCRLIEEVFKANELSDRIKVFNGFVGGTSPTISEKQLMSDIGFDKIDLLKCDIEGAEFELLRAGSPLLAITRQIAMEVHPTCGDADALIALLKSEGFQVESHAQGPTFLVFARR